MSKPLEHGFEKLEHALQSLEEMIQEPMHANRMNVDACIQRFEYTIELYWKLLQRILQFEGIIFTPYPLSILRAAYKGNLIDNEQAWLQMLDDRNKMSHIYNESLADEVYAHIKQNFPVMKNTFETLSKKYRKQKDYSHD
jgi:nucleotidyltransferase substrate binding protein (TIGR01987 family)